MSASTSFAIDAFVDACKACNGDVRLVAETVRAALAAPDAIVAALAGNAGDRVLFADDALTVLNVRIPPGFRTPPHDHTMWAVVGIYEGQENNTFYRLIDGVPQPVDQHEVHAPGVLTLDGTTVHAIHNPLQRPTCGLHVYGGHLDRAQRSLWDPDTGERHAFSVELAGRYARALMAAARR